MKLSIDKGWSILQDVHDDGEALGIYDDPCMTIAGNQLSEWEPLERLEHLQLALSEHPYWGRELRSFNEAPWWYRNVITLSENVVGQEAVLKFSNVDYFCKVWFNGHLVQKHEGYSAPFECDVSEFVKAGENSIIVKVWSPWDVRVRDDKFSLRTHQVERNLVKGTYEHSDGLIARDVNPVGIYGSVSFESHDSAYFIGEIRCSCNLEDTKQGMVTLRGSLSGSSSLVGVKVMDPDDEIVSESTYDIAGGFDLSVPVPHPKLWWTWDLGEQNLYTVIISLDGGESREYSIGFRNVELVRSQSLTKFSLNGSSLYVRGTSYFPDVYMSAMTTARYERDLRAIKSAGFNLIRVHVHVENQEFYDMCDRIGLAVIQDSEYNWTQPKTEEWAEKFIRIYLETVRLLDRHVSIICWICLNEPGVVDEIRGTHGVAMSESPGPQVYKAVSELDSTRPIIKGSFCDDDPTSGDSHNYTGSLDRAEEPYTAIDGTTEKLNTEFGFDAPGDFSNLRHLGDLSKRILGLESIVPELQHYQTRLVKYYLEHYRCQKGNPNWGYVQFMFIDLCPQSFYGVLDWWGLPKPLYAELTRINQPVGVYLDQTAHHINGIVAVNDYPGKIVDSAVSWCLINRGTQLRIKGESTLDLMSDAVNNIETIDLDDDGSVWDAHLAVRNTNGKIIATNEYSDIFGHPDHPKGHPDRISHEYGVRVYSV